MDVMQESYNALEKNSNEALQINMSKTWFAVAIRR
jgi:chemotaxis protein MotB